MNLPYLHLLLNHVPILAAFFGICLLIWGLAAKQNILLKAAFSFFVFAALITVPVMFSGEEAEELVENIPSVSHNMVEEHEEAAKPAYFATLALGALSLFSLLIAAFGKRLGKTINIITLLLAIVAFVLLARAGLQGGKIIHTEINGTGQPQAPFNDHNDDD